MTKKPVECPSCAAQGREPDVIRLITYHGVKYKQCAKCKFWSTDSEAWPDVS